MSPRTIEFSTDQLIDMVGVAAESDDREAVTGFIKTIMNRNPSPGEKQSLLIAALPLNDFEIIASLAAKNPLLDQKFGNGLTALQIAAHNGYAQSIKALLGSGTSLNLGAVTEDGNGLLHLAAAQGHNHVIYELLSNKNSKDTFKNAIDAPNNVGNTALHYAVLSGSTASVAALLNAGADPNSVNNDGKTPGTLARDPNLKELLIKRGAYIPDERVATRDEIEAMTPLQRESFRNAQYSNNAAPRRRDTPETGAAR